MQKIIYLLLFMVLLGCDQVAPYTNQGRLDIATKELSDAKTEKARFYALNNAATESFVAGEFENARKYAEELLLLMDKFKNNWNYGNAVQDSNLVLGRLAVHENRILEAKKYLLAAGRSPGSSQMDTFGPNMSLAKDLLEQEEYEVVLEYFELCRVFWDMERGRLDKWSKQVRNKKIPRFGTNIDRLPTLSDILQEQAR